MSCSNRYSKNLLEHYAHGPTGCLEHLSIRNRAVLSFFWDCWTPIIEEVHRNVFGRLDDLDSSTEEEETIDETSY